ncbi:MAG: hypothetical protein A2W80_02575 [Candidatus Riflebacteria bacterium GWC2_50_8]|nr:MAG: hypothetical protein A2W80_02575 [Candidatus Riflebacteria bacterium GWC2_50_8]
MFQKFKNQQQSYTACTLKPLFFKQFFALSLHKACCRLAMMNIISDKNHLLTQTCRQCHGALSAKTQVCPLCGLSRPNYNELTALEKQYLESAPTVPGKFHYMCETVKPDKSLGKNIANEMRTYMGSPEQSWLLWLSMLSVAGGGAMLLMQVAFPLSFMLFWAGMVYAGFDAINFMRAVVVSFLVHRLQLKAGMSPYSVHFKIEDQLLKMLQSLQMVINSFYETDWTRSEADKQKAADNFVNAAVTLTSRIKVYADLSLETAAIIWRNNVYAIVANNNSFQEKAIAVGNKIREAEALILRYRWLNRLASINERLMEHIAADDSKNAANNIQRRQEILGEFLLSPYGPMAEPYSGGFDSVPFELPFVMRFFWHQQLPPFPLSGEELLSEVPAIADFFESIQQVRKLKGKLEEQMILDCASTAIDDISKLDGDQSTMIEAQQLQRFQLYAQYLDVPKFNPDSEELQKRIDKLKGQLRVAMSTKPGV